MGSYVWFAIWMCFLAFVSIILIRTLTFTAKKESHKVALPIITDKDKAIADLSSMIKCKTVSDKDTANENDVEFEKFKALLPVMFPNIYKKCEFSEVGRRGLLYRLKGESSDAPAVLMAHYDVVSAEESEWAHDPFAATIENDFLWGRGTLDTKATLNGAMQALESFIKAEKTPKNDVYLAFSGDEEVNGGSASAIVDLFEERGITPSVVLDEGGAVVNNVFPGVTSPAALIGIAEKGMLNVEIAYTGNGGHASAPKSKTPIGSLSKACLSIEKKPFKFRFTEASTPMFDNLARHSNFFYRMIFANLWCFSPVLNVICKKSGGEINALLRTTCAFTQMEGSQGMNVIPAKAKIIANLRILPGETMETTLTHLKKAVKDPDISITKIDGMNPSVISNTESLGFTKISSAISDVWCDAIISPYLMFACSDSRHWGRISKNVYRFSPMLLTSEDRATIHGNDEKISLDAIVKIIEFYTRLLELL